MSKAREHVVTGICRPTNAVTNSPCIKRVAFIGTIAILNYSACLAHGWSHDPLPIVRPAMADYNLLLVHSRRRPSTPPRQTRVVNFLGRLHDRQCNASLDASSWGDEGEHLCEEVISGDTAEDADADVANPSNERGRLRRVGKRIALVSAVGLSILGEGYVQSVAGSALAIAAALKASKSMARKRPSESSKDEERLRPNKSDAAKRWLLATMGNLERIDEEVAEERRFEMKQREAERIERGREWARQSLQTTDELKRKADEARREEAAARRWADDMIQQDMQRQRNADMERFGKRFGGDES